MVFFFFNLFFNDTATTEIYTLSLHDALPIWFWGCHGTARPARRFRSRPRQPHLNLLKTLPCSEFTQSMEIYHSGPISDLFRLIPSAPRSEMKPRLRVSKSFL